MNRRKLSQKDKLEILIRQSVCPLCGERLGKLEDVDFDHVHPLALGGSDNDNGNFQALHRSCHRVKTSGTKATSAGSDIHEIAKTKRLDKKNAEFMRLISSRECGSKRAPKGKIKSRGFEKRKKG
jgi:5-methylcytosine-specific restriction endonuclease McrA